MSGKRAIVLYLNFAKFFEQYHCVWEVIYKIFMFWSKLIRIYRITVSGLVVKIYKAVLYIPTQNFSEFRKKYLLIFSENTINN